MTSITFVAGVGHMELSVFNAWSGLPDSALELLAKAETENLFNGTSWYSAYSSSVVGRQDKTHWLCLSRDNVALLLLPLVEQPSGGMKRLSSLSNYYTPYFSPIVCETDRAHLLAETFRLARRFLATFDIIELYPLTPDDLAEFQHASRSAGLRAFSTIQTYNWRQLGIADFESYWTARDSSLQNTVRRKQRKTEKAGDFSYRVVLGEGVEQALADYQTVYAQSWKTEEDHPAFIETLIRSFAANGALRLAVLTQGEKPVAAQLWLVHDETAYIYKLAYDPAFAKLSVGTLLSHFVFRWVVENDGVRHVDFLTGDDSYKAQWMDERRPLYRLTLANAKRPRGALFALKQFIKKCYLTRLWDPGRC